MMPIAIDCDTLEGEDLDKTIKVLLDRRKEIFEKVEKNVSTAQHKQKVSCYICSFLLWKFLSRLVIVVKWSV